MGTTVQLLKKITLSLSAGIGPGKSDTSGSPLSFAFIYGVASDGLCPFENALHDKGEGERLVVRVKAADAEIAKKLDAAAAALAAARSNALTEIEGVAADAARDIVAKLTGATVTDAAARKAVAGAMSRA